MRSKVCSWEAAFPRCRPSGRGIRIVSPDVEPFVPQQNPLHRSKKQVRTYAVKVDGEGWVGVSADTSRCHGHAHPTPELAKLCALHRAQPADAEGKVVLMPVLPAAPRERRRAAGDGHRG